MGQIGVLWVGKGRDRLLGELVARYQARLERFAKVTMAHVAEATGEGRSPAEARRLEAERLRQVLTRWERGKSGSGPGRSPGRSPGLLVVLDERGQLLTSAQLAEQLTRATERGLGRTSFVIGGDEGVDPALRDEAGLLLSLSRMTFTHEFARAVLMEQLYRAHAIQAGHPYHRE